MLAAIGEERGMSIFAILGLYSFSSVNADSVVHGHVGCLSWQFQFILCLKYDDRLACWSSPRNLTPVAEAVLSQRVITIFIIFILILHLFQMPLGRNPLPA